MSVLRRAHPVTLLLGALVLAVAGAFALPSQPSAPKPALEFSLAADDPVTFAPRTTPRRVTVWFAAAIPLFPGRDWLAYHVRVDGITAEGVVGFYADTPTDAQRAMLRERAETCARDLLLRAYVSCDTTRDLRRLGERPHLLPCT